MSAATPSPPCIGPITLTCAPHFSRADTQLWPFRGTQYAEASGIKAQWNPKSIRIARYDKYFTHLFIENTLIYKARMADLEAQYAGPTIMLSA